MKRKAHKVLGTVAIIVLTPLAVVAIYIITKGGLHR